MADLFSTLRQISAQEAAQRLPLSHLSKKGGRLWCECPLHADKTPSLCIYPGDRGFYCFSCHTGGDSITLYKIVLGYQRMIDAAKQMAKDFGIQTDDELFKQQPRIATSRELEQMLRDWQRKKLAAFREVQQKLIARIEFPEVPTSMDDAELEAYLARHDQTTAALAYISEQISLLEDASIDDVAAAFKSERQQQREVAVHGI